MTAAPVNAAISREAVQHVKRARCVRSEGRPSRTETRTGGRRLVWGARLGLDSWAQRGESVIIFSPLWTDSEAVEKTCFWAHCRRCLGALQGMCHRLGGVRGFPHKQNWVLGRDSADGQGALVGHTVQKAAPHVTRSPIATERHCVRDAATHHLCALPIYSACTSAAGGPPSLGHGHGVDVIAGT